MLHSGGGGPPGSPAPAQHPIIHVSQMRQSCQKIVSTHFDSVI